MVAKNRLLKAETGSKNLAKNKVMATFTSLTTGKVKSYNKKMPLQMRPVTFGEEEEQVSNTEVTQKSSNKKGGWSFADIGSCYDFLRADESNRRCLYELRGIDSRTIRFKKDWRCSVCFANLSSKRNFQIYYEDLHKETRYDVGWYPDMPLPKYTVMENP